MARRLALLVNPAAGGGRAARLARPVAERLRRDGDAVAVVAGRDAGAAARRLAAVLGAGVDGVVALGGDGFVHLALQAVAGTGVPLGIVPGGTGNDGARTLGLPSGRRLRDALAAADVVRDGRVRDVDAGLVRTVSPGGAGPAYADGGRWFLSVLSSGFDAQVSERATRLAWPRGRARYHAALVAELRVFRPRAYVLTLDGRPWHTEAMLVAVGNGASYGGGMRICPAADPADGAFDVTVLQPVSTAELLRVFPSVYRGTHVRHPAVVTHRARTVGLASPDTPAYADGERVGALPVTAETMPGALRVFAPDGT